MTAAEARDTIAAGLTDDTCRSFFRRLAAGVAVITADGADGPCGMTASAVTSLSMHPPLVVACLAHDSRTLEAVRWSGLFGLHLLRDDQQPTAETFGRAGRTPRVFAERRLAGGEGPPMLSTALAWASCGVEQALDRGDHCLLIGRVLAAGSKQGSPLLWHLSSYHRITDQLP